MPGFNLVRNSKVFFTSNVNATTGVVAEGSLTAAKTQELAVLNGFSFSQATDAQTITVSEAGETPARGQRSFNTALQAVDFSFTTYIRPRGAVSAVDMDEKVLWNALFATGEINLTPTGTATAGEFAVAVTSTTRATTTNTVVFAWSSVNLTATGIAAGDRVNISGVPNNTGDLTGFNGGATISAIGGTVGACTGITVLLDVAPTGTGNPSTTTGYTLTVSKNSAALRMASVASGEAGHVKVTPALSNKNQLQKFGLVVLMDQTTYVIDNCVLDQAQIDFGLDGIARVQWTGKGTILRSLAASGASAGTFSGALTGTYTIASDNNTGYFITTKVSTAVVKSTFAGGGTGAKTYTVALTGGTLTIANNVNYITPETLGVVNKPIGYYTGTRAVSGNITAYLKTSGTNPTATLLSDLLAAPAETKYYMELAIGGASNAVKVELEMPAVTLQVPSVDVQDVVATTINFAAQASVLPDSSAAALADTSTTSYYDLEASNDMIVRYYSV
jgi:hypothetical protein